MSASRPEIPDVVPLFPLPEVVLFPNIILPLHIFEPRYREMAADALRGDSIIAMALLKPGFEELYSSSSAPIHPVICIGKVIVSEQLQDGTYNLLLRGQARARIVEELPGKAYRRARATALESSAADDAAAFTGLRESLRTAINEFTTVEPDLRRHWLSLFDTAIDLGEMADLIAGGLQVEAELRQCLLAEPVPTARAALLLDVLRATQAVTRQRRAVRSTDAISRN